MEMVLLRTLAVFCVGTAAKLEARGQLRAKWMDRFTDLSSAKDDKGTVLLIYYTSVCQVVPS